MRTKTATASPRAARVALRISRSLHKRAVLLAQREDVSLNSWLVEAIAVYVGAYEAARKAEPEAGA